MPPRYSTISAATEACRQSFEGCLTMPYLMENEWAENTLADFNLWSDGAGASAGGRASLDSRLEYEPDIKNVIINLLRMLIALVEKCRRIVAQDMTKKCPLELPNLTTKLPEDSAEALLVMHVEDQATVPTRCVDDAIADEREALKQDTQRVKDVLKEVVRLTAAIRKSGSSSRFRRADSLFKAEDHKKLSDHLHFILTACPSKDRTQASQRDTSKIDTIQRRLIEANLMRRNRFIYQQKHSEKLATRERHLVLNPRRRIFSIWRTAKNLVLSPFQLSLPTTRTKAPNSTLPPAQETPRLEQNPQSTSASKVETRIEKDQPQNPSTVVSSTLARAEYPEPPLLQPKSAMFKCPCCCQYLPKDIAQHQSRWKKHLREDIQPYTCILKSCPRPLSLFDNQNLWINHMRTEHENRRFWICPDIDCSSQDPFENEQDFKSHLQTNHPELTSENDMQLLISVYGRSVSIEIQSCPLCPSDVKPTGVDVALLLKHIAEHMQSFSMKSLPEPPEEDPENGYFKNKNNKYFNISGKVGSAVRDQGTSSDCCSTELEPLVFHEDEQQKLVLPTSSPNGSETSSDSSPDMPLHGSEHLTTTRKMAASNLQDQLFAALIEQRPGSQSFYIPEDKKLAIVTRTAIEEQCRFGATGRAVSRHVETIYNIGRNLFTILGYIGEAPEICAFIDEGLTDSDLPFVYQPASRTLTRKNGVAIQSATHWPNTTGFAFARDQWHILVPIFSDKEHYVFHDNIILPFTYEKLDHVGAYSEMYGATIHPAHHNWSQGPGSSELSVAIKRLHAHNEEDFERERSMLVTLETKRNDHLVKLLFSYEHKGSYHLAFLRAKGNLRDYWEQNPRPQLTLEMVRWSLNQMIGITQGLQIIHCFKVSTPLSVTEMETETPQGKAKMRVGSGEERYGRHGDLKPENILFFQNPTGAVCQIADFGHGRFHSRDTKTKAAPYTISSSPTYEPPECHIYLPVSRAYDLWSLGCLLLEWASWMLGGWQAIDDFSRSRLEQSLIMNKEGIIRDDYFWTLVIDGNKRDGRVRNGVEQWVLRLRAHPNCSQLIQDLLTLIMNDLLCIVPRSRSNAAMLHSNLQGLLSHAEREHGYAMNQSTSGPIITTVDPRYIDGERLMALLKRLFPSRSYSARIKNTTWLINAPRALTEEELQEAMPTR